MLRTMSCQSSPQALGQSLLSVRNHTDQVSIPSQFALLVLLGPKRFTVFQDLGKVPTIPENTSGKLKTTISNRLTGESLTEQNTYRVANTVPLAALLTENRCLSIQNTVNLEGFTIRMIGNGSTKAAATEQELGFHRDNALGTGLYHHGFDRQTLDQ